MMQTTTAKPIKVYVAVKTDFAADGTMLPREITWEDGERFEIDRILDIRQAAAMKAGGQGDRYTVRIRGKQSYSLPLAAPKATTGRLRDWHMIILWIQ